MSYWYSFLVTINPYWHVQQYPTLHLRKSHRVSLTTLSGRALPEMNGEHCT